MKYRIDARYVWYDGGKQIVLMYFIQGFPFTWDEVPGGGIYDLDLISLADAEKRWEPDTLYRSSMYLIAEEANPLVFEMEDLIENPECMPSEY